MYRIFKWKKVVIKESSFDEVKKIEEARKILKTHKIEINNIEYSLHLPKIYAFKNNKIYMEFLKGDNLELILRTPQNRKSGVQILNSIFQYLYDNKIYWKDFAPRNI